MSIIWQRNIPGRVFQSNLSCQLFKTLPFRHTMWPLLTWRIGHNSGESFQNGLQNWHFRSVMQTVVTSISKGWTIKGYLENSTIIILVIAIVVTINLIYCGELVIWCNWVLHYSSNDNHWNKLLHNQSFGTSSLCSYWTFLL